MNIHHIAWYDYHGLDLYPASWVEGLVTCLPESIAYPLHVLLIKCLFAVAVHGEHGPNGFAHVNVSMQTKTRLVFSQYHEGSDCADEVGAKYHFPRKYYGLLTLSGSLSLQQSQNRRNA